MFSINKNGIYNVNSARAGVKQDGNSYTLVKLIERENQPEGMERPSQSYCAVNLWNAKVDGGEVTDGCQIEIVDFTGINWLHEERIYNGKKTYRDTLELSGAEIRVLK